MMIDSLWGTPFYKTTIDEKLRFEVETYIMSNIDLDDPPGDVSSHNFFDSRHPLIQKLKQEKVEKDKELNKKRVEEAEKKLDPVDDAANDKKFKDRKDKDIDNDGDVDSSDEYLHNRRAKVDDAIDGGKKPAKKEEDDKKKVVAKSPKVAEISKIGEEFIAMLEAAIKPDEKLKSDGKDKDGKELSKGALDDEEIDEKEPKKGKEFIKKHDGSDKKIEDAEEDGHDVTFKAGSNATKPKSGKRPTDNPAGDAKVVSPVKEEYDNPLAGKGYPEQENNEPAEVQSLVQMAKAHLAGQTKDFQKL